MSYQQLFDSAYTLCVKFNSHAVAHDLACMSETELRGVIYFFTSMMSS